MPAVRMGTVVRGPMRRAWQEAGDAGRAALLQWGVQDLRFNKSNRAFWVKLVPGKGDVAGLGSTVVEAPLEAADGQQAEAAGQAREGAEAGGAEAAQEAAGSQAAGGAAQEAQAGAGAGQGGKRAGEGDAGGSPDGRPAKRPAP